MGILIKGIDVPEDGHIDIRIYPNGFATTPTVDPPYYEELTFAPVDDTRRDLVSRADLFNQLAYVNAPPEANDYKAAVYTIIQNMEVKI